MVNRPRYKLTIEDLQDGCCGSNCGYRNKMSNSESPCRPNASHPGGHLGCRKGTNLAVLNFHVSTMPLTNFSSIRLTVREQVVSGFSRWPPWWPSWILEQNKFSNSKSPSHTKFRLNPTYRSETDVV